MSVDILWPKASAELIAGNAIDVTVNREGVKTAAKVALEAMKSGRYSLQTWKEQALNPKEMNADAVDWYIDGKQIFFADTLNFSFWSDDSNKRYSVSHDGISYTGYLSFCAAIQRAIKNGIPITKASFYATISKEQFEELFKSECADTELPLLDERVRILRETGQVLLKDFGGSFINCISQCNQSAQSLLRMIIKNFPSYRDESVFNGQKVSFYKRAQILIGDLWACFEGQSFGTFHDIDSITMFADYRIPQALLYFGALRYSDGLLEKLKSGDLLANGDRYEVEIRGCTIWAVEVMKEEMRKLAADDPGFKGHNLINSIMIDFFLWDYRRENSHVIDSSTHYHKTRCIFY